MGNTIGHKPTLDSLDHIQQHFLDHGTLPFEPESILRTDTDQFLSQSTQNYPGPITDDDDEEDSKGASQEPTTTNTQTITEYDMEYSQALKGIKQSNDRICDQCGKSVNANNGKTDENDGRWYCNS